VRGSRFSVHVFVYKIIHDWLRHSVLYQLTFLQFTIFQCNYCPMIFLQLTASDRGDRRRSSSSRRWFYERSAYSPTTLKLKM
jgi:hypothetical protein